MQPKPDQTSVAAMIANTMAIPTDVHLVSYQSPTAVARLAAGALVYSIS